jgi:hypothetical protein
MKLKKLIFLMLIISLLFTVTNFTGCIVNPENPLKNFSKQIEIGNFNDISLTIYYMSPYISTYYPLSVDDLINQSDDVQKFVIDGKGLEEYRDLLKRTGNVTLIPVKNISYLNARIYYVFETEQRSKIFDVAMWGGNNNSMFINGFEIKSNDIFYDLIIPFLPEDEVKDLQAYLDRG